MTDLVFPNAARRDFLSRAGGLVASAMLPGLPDSAWAEPPPETSRIRLAYGPWICYAPQLLAEDLLHAEGFSEVEIVKHPASYIKYLTEDHSDLAIFGAPNAVRAVDDGDPVKMLCGIHPGCWELFVSQRVSAVHDLKGAKVAIVGPGVVDHLWASSICSFLGIDPLRDIEWKHTGSLDASQRSFEEGTCDAFVAFPPQPQYLRARGIGRTIVNIGIDRPWSRYFCCIAAASNRFVQTYPIATKRAIRALLKAADICSRAPEKAARALVDRGFEPRFDIALEVLRSIGYKHWRDWNPADTLRFHALRLHEAGMIKSRPSRIVAEGGDFRFLNELKAELKS